MTKFALGRKLEDVDGAGGDPTLTGGLGSMRSNKMAPEGLIGQPDINKKKSIVVLSHKQVEKSKRDIVTVVPKPIIVKDLLNVMKADSRLVHKPLMY